MSSGKTWWDEMLEGRFNDGKSDADRGIYQPPYQDNNDPQEDDENSAYKSGFHQRRKELGDRFKWA